MTLQNEGGLPEDIASLLRVNRMYAALLEGTREERELVFDMYIVPKDEGRRLLRRDQVLRVIWHGTRENLKDSPKAKIIEQLYKRYLSIKWPRDQKLDFPPPSDNWLDGYWFHLARFSGGESLGFRQIINIKKGKRS